MAKREFTVFKENDSRCFVNGIGYLPYDRRHAVTLGIRRMTNMLCLCIFLYFVLQKFLLFPITLSLYFFGARVQINYFTGLVVSSEFSKALIMVSTNILSLMACTAICFLVYRKAHGKAQIFKAPHKGITLISVPIIVAVSILGLLFGILETLVGSFTGIVFPFFYQPISIINKTVILQIVGGLFFACIQEIFFRGAVLTPLRRYGDGFAIIASSALFSLWSGRALEAIPAFVLSIGLAYFTIRSGSIITAVICRLSCELVELALRICYGTFGAWGIAVSIAAALAISLVLAAIAVRAFRKRDKTAFSISKSCDGLGVCYKLSVAVTSLVFIIFMGYLLIKVFDTVQIIG